jgi:glycerol-3-phosphate O-acyltransferase
MDFYRVLRTGGSEESILMQEAYSRVDRTLGILREFEQDHRLRLDASLKQKDTGAVVGEALAHLKSYHRRPALLRRGDRLFHIDRNLLLYYHNRLTGFGLPTWEKPQ